MSIPRVLVIAGSDSSGGAGLEADQRTLAAHGCYAMTATTALTAQNTTGVEDIHIIPPAFVGKQIRKVMEDGFMEGEPGVVKIGMLASAETIEFVAAWLKEWMEKSGKDLKIVLDPVMVATSGSQLLENTAVRNLRKLLLPITTVLTPNIPEATLLLRDAGIDAASPSTLEDMKSLAKELHGLGPKHILLKGGHMPLTTSYTKATTHAEKAVTVDILYPSIAGGNGWKVIESKYLDIPNTHGTGCSLASALAANIASSSLTPPIPSNTDTTSSNLTRAVQQAVTYVSNGILTSQTLTSSLHNHGPGPIHHLHSTIQLPFPLGHFIPYLLSHPTITPIWETYVHHPFTTALGNGSLPIDNFKRYLIQDYLFLTHFARSHALAGYKATHISQTSSSAKMVMHVQEEMEMHVSWCEEFNISKHDLETAKEAPATTAYSRWMLDVGMSGDLLGLWVAGLACLIGYGEVGKRLQQEQSTPEDMTPSSVSEQTEQQRNRKRYSRWIQNYTSPSYTSAVSEGRAQIEDEIMRLGGVGKGRVEELVGIFERGIMMEGGFWDAALKD